MNILTDMTPARLKRLPKEDIDTLCAQIRRRLIETVTQNGGHLASNLGAVELTVALHRAFDCPRDKIVWDVGHQSYVHKLLTGREPRFDTLRKRGGLSGSPGGTKASSTPSARGIAVPRFPPRWASPAPETFGATSTASLR